MSFLTSTRVVRTALASAALLVLGTVAAPAANAYNPDIDGDTSQHLGNEGLRR